jgi:flagellar hook-length control protein FliK
MVYERERNSLTVRLDPPELGVVELRIQATGGEVQAWLTAERDLTRQMLQQAQQYLREQLESRGLHLTHFDVGAQSQFQHAPREQHTRYAAQTVSTRTPTATDSLLYDGRWSVWV